MREDLEEAVKDAAFAALVDAAEDGEFDPASLDPTGIAALVDAFNFPVCSELP